MECLAEAWKVVCLDPVTGTNQNIETYWAYIKAEFDKRKLVDPYFKGVHMKRGSKAMANHCGLIQTACNKWHGIVEEVAARPESRTSVEDQVSHTVHVAAFSPRACSFALCAPWACPGARSGAD